MATSTSPSLPISIRTNHHTPQDHPPYHHIHQVPTHPIQLFTSSPDPPSHPPTTAQTPSPSQPLPPIQHTPSPSSALHDPKPTHFLSRASRRLPELHQQLNLNPELPRQRTPTEIDPLLVHPSNLQILPPSPPFHPPSPPRLHPAPIHQTLTHLSPSLNPNLTNNPNLPPPYPKKLNTFDGVFLPTILNVFNVVYFIRFAYCLGQIGLLATIGLLLVAYLIGTLTVFSLSAIATNGQVRGGGAYYLISRTLGPEFGGSIGILFCLSQAMTAAMNIIGFVEALDSVQQTLFHSHPQHSTVQQEPNIQNASSSLFYYLLKTCTLLGATLTCILLGKNKIFCSMTRSVSSVLLLTLLTILFSFITKQPFSYHEQHLKYTSFSSSTFKQNLFPNYHPLDHNRFPPESLAEIRTKFSDYQGVFGIIFPSLSGVLAGSSLSGELRKPSKSLPTGMIAALIFTIIVYVVTLVCLSMTCARESLSFLNQRGFLNLILLQISSYPAIMSMGLLLGTLFSSVMGITVCGKILQAVSRDGLIPIMKPFFSQGSQIGDDPVYSIMLCFIVCQLGLFYNVSQLAVHITSISLLVFACINLACFTLRIAGSPNFRPSFRLFSEWTALLGLALAFTSMYLVGPVFASTSIIAMIILFVVIHYSSPAKQWGEVTQSIIYHQVRKYLLRLDERKDNVKYWRPQILLFTNDPRRDWNQIVFCNSLKKGGLYILAHIIKSEFSPDAIKELQEQQLNWLGLVDISNIKAFVDLTLAPDERVGARQLLLTAGLGGMRPNICILGFPTNLKWRGRGKLIESGEGEETISSTTPMKMKRRSDSSVTIKGMVIESAMDVGLDSLGSLPTDSQRSETPIKPTDFVGIIEDTLSLNKSIGLTFGFTDLRLPRSISRPQTVYSNPDHQLFNPDNNNPFHAPDSLDGKRWIDLWPILRDGESGWETYTMVLQLGTVLSMVPSWRHHHNLRVNIFCEYDEEIGEERRRMEKLMSDLRIRATLRVVVLAGGHIPTYECLVKGKTVDQLTWSKLERTLAGDPWWETLKFMRAQDLPRSEDSTTQTATSSSKPPSHSLNESLLKKNSQTNNIRIKALHPFSRRSSHPETHRTQPVGTTTGGNQDDDDDDDLILEDNDGDDDTIARAAYSRNKKPATLRGLPDEPMPVKSKTTAHSVPIPDYGSTFEHQSLDLQSLSPSSLHNGAFVSSPPRKRTAAPRSCSISSSSSSSGSSTPTFIPNGADDWIRRAGIFQNSTAPSSSSNPNKQRAKGLASFIHRKRFMNHKNKASTRSFTIDENEESFVEDQLERGRRSFTNGHRTCFYSSSAKPSTTAEPLPSSNTTSTGLPPPPVVELDFNSLPMHAQLICLNELIRFNSLASSSFLPPSIDSLGCFSSSTTAVIFTSLPPPEPRISHSFEGSARYLDQIESFLNDLPPVLAIYAKQFSVTASL